MAVVVVVDGKSSTEILSRNRPNFTADDESVLSVNSVGFMDASQLPVFF